MNVYAAQHSLFLFSFHCFYCYIVLVDERERGTVKSILCCRHQRECTAARKEEGKARKHGILMISSDVMANSGDHDHLGWLDIKRERERERRVKNVCAMPLPYF